MHSELIKTQKIYLISLNNNFDRSAYYTIYKRFDANLLKINMFD